MEIFMVFFFLDYERCISMLELLPTFDLLYPCAAWIWHTAFEPVISKAFTSTSSLISTRQESLGLLQSAESLRQRLWRLNGSGKQISAEADLSASHPTQHSARDFDDGDHDEVSISSSNGEHQSMVEEWDWPPGHPHLQPSSHPRDLDTHMLVCDCILLSLFTSIPISIPELFPVFSAALEGPTPSPSPSPHPSIPPSPSPSSLSSSSLGQDTVELSRRKFVVDVLCHDMLHSRNDTTLHSTVNSLLRDKVMVGLHINLVECMVMAISNAFSCDNDPIIMPLLDSVPVKHRVDVAVKLLTIAHSRLVRLMHRISAAARSRSKAISSEARVILSALSPQLVMKYTKCGHGYGGGGDGDGANERKRRNLRVELGNVITLYKLYSFISQHMKDTTSTEYANVVEEARTVHTIVELIKRNSKRTSS